MTHGNVYRIEKSPSLLRSTRTASSPGAINIGGRIWAFDRGETIVGEEHSGKGTEVLARGRSVLRQSRALKLGPAPLHGNAKERPEGGSGEKREGRLDRRRVKIQKARG